MSPSDDRLDFDVQDLDADALELWNKHRSTGAPSVTTQMDLYSFAEICRLELGRVPVAVEKALDPELGPMLQHYREHLKRARGGSTRKQDS